MVVPGEDPNPPVADAGTDQVVDEDAFVQLDGCQSHEPDGEPITTTWVFEGYSPATNLPVPVLQPSVTDCAAYYFTPRFSRLGGLDMHFRLDVTSSRGGMDSDTVTIHVNDSVNENPLADADPQFSATERILFYLNGSPDSVITITGNDLISVTNLTFNGYGGSIKPSPTPNSRSGCPMGDGSGL